MRESKSGRKIRRCAEKFYDDDIGLNINTHNITTFDLCDKVTSEVFDANDGSVTEIEANDVTLQNLMRRGFHNPFIVRANTGKPPGLRVPNGGEFSVKDVERLVGPTRKVDVMDVGTQRSLQMTMHQWAKYFESDKRETLLNVISLEVSKTALCEIIDPPDFVRELDWVEVAWPPPLKKSQSIGTNNMSKMKYPKVQKYCLMSVRGSYTDFHVDFGGTSVWYHLVEGAKVFWLIPPTEENLAKFVKWTLAGKQNDVFFGDLVDKCMRINLYAGDTFYLPGGWIHGVYTPRKSLVFGGNFLHSYNIVGQLQVTAIEEITLVEARYLYPYFVEMVWFVINKYNKYLKHIEDHGKGNSVLLEEEVEGLNLLISRLEESEIFQSAIPVQIKTPKLLLQNVRDLLVHAEIDKTCTDYSEPLLSRDKNLTDGDNSPRKIHNMRLIATSRPFTMSPVPLYSDSEASDVDTSFEQDPDNEDSFVVVDDEPTKDSDVTDVALEDDSLEKSPRKRRKLKPSIMDSYLSTFDLDDEDDMTSPVKLQPLSESKPAHKTPPQRQSPGSSAQSPDTAKRKRRCGTCEKCAAKNCGDCKFCRDMKCYGGPNQKRQSCVNRRCANIREAKGVSSPLTLAYQKIFNVAKLRSACSLCSLSQSDWKLDPMLSCWNCTLALHWNCQSDPAPSAPPTEQELAVVWRWKCRSCQEQQQKRYGVPLSLKVPHQKVAVPVTLSVPLQNVAVPVSLQVPRVESSQHCSGVGNIFSKLGPLARTEQKPVIPTITPSNIFTKFKPKLILTDSKKSEIIQQAKTALENNTLISPSTLPLLASQSLAGQLQIKSVKSVGSEEEEPVKVEEDSESEILDVVSDQPLDKLKPVVALSHLPSV